MLTSQKHAVPTLALCGALTLSQGTHAETVPLDSFEDGNIDGWQHTTIVGSRCCNGSFGVEDHNGSLMAFVKHPGNGQDSLSMDFGYDPNASLSFDMHAVANLGSTYTGGALHSMSGVKISFLNFLNASLGSLTVANATNPSWIGAGNVPVDNAQHRYSGLLATYAAAAGLGAGDAIAKVSLEFFATAQYSWGGNIYPNGASTGNVWFDNVQVSAVPLPPAAWLLGSGIVGLAGITRRKTR